MNATEPLDSDATTTALPPRVRGLWAEACNWVAWLCGMFDLATLRTTGISREHGARVGIWLMNIEGAIRRLILSAALALAPPAPRVSRTCAATRAPVAASSRRPGFRVFRLQGAGDTQPRVASHTPRTPKPYGHIPFPTDPLLCVGSAQPRTHSAPTQRARNPLDRWVRPSRQDPDWRAPEDSDFFFRDHASRNIAPRAATRTHARPQPQTQEAFPPSLTDWRRHHDAWTQPVPAPDLATRLAALAHIIANPAAAIASAARRLHASSSNAPTLTQRVRPEPPKRAAHIATAGHTDDFLKRCCDAAFAPDTS